MKDLYLTERRRKILTFWYLCHKETNLWPSLSEAELELGIPKPTIQININVLVKNGWMVKNNKQIGLSKAGEKSLLEAEMISTGQMKKSVNRIANMVKKKKRDYGKRK